MLGAIRNRNHERAPAARYIGLDIEPCFQQHWAQHEGTNIQFLVQDVLAFDGFAELSLATSIFTLQFLPERHRREVCRKIYEGLVPGGAFIVAEKTFAKIPKTQDMLMSLYLHYKRRHFSDEEIMDKEKSLRDKMKPGREADLIRLLTEVGFTVDAIEPFWAQPHVRGLRVREADGAGGRIGDVVRDDRLPRIPAPLPAGLLSRRGGSDPSDRHRRSPRPGLRRRRGGAGFRSLRCQPDRHGSRAAYAGRIGQPGAGHGRQNEADLFQSGGRTGGPGPLPPHHHGPGSLVHAYTDLPCPAGSMADARRRNPGLHAGAEPRQR